ncbi:hypothetical protein PQX77_003293 [Marasmius sp. AFHP31]|nr:hypothetical protein PQX77_003293 [Marasmius sp. AFHP31]
MPPERASQRNHPTALSVSGWASPSPPPPPPPQTEEDREQAKILEKVKWKGTWEQYQRQLELEERTDAYYWRKQLSDQLGEEKNPVFLCPPRQFCVWMMDLRAFDIKRANGQPAPTFHRSRKKLATDLYMQHIEDRHLRPDGLKWRFLNGQRVLEECDPVPYVED